MLKTFIRQAHSGKVSMLPGISGTYAYSLFQVVQSQNCLDDTVTRLGQVSKVIQDNKKVSSVVNNPALSMAQRLEVAKSLPSAQKDKSNTYLTNLFITLAENNRLQYIPQINTSLMELYDQYKGIVSVTLTTAKPWNSDSQRDKVGSKLTQTIKNSKLLSKDQSVKMSYKVDPDLLGGLVLEIGDKTIDLSVKSKVQNLNNLLKSDL